MFYTGSDHGYIFFVLFSVASVSVERVCTLPNTYLNQEKRSSFVKNI